MPNPNNNSVQDKFITLENLEHYNDYVYPEEMTWDEYQEITPEYGKTYFITDYDSEQSADADAIAYDNTDSDLHASNVQDAIDELSSEKKDEYTTITYAQWQQMTPTQQTEKDYYISDYPSSAITAGNISYSNTTSELDAQTIQAAIDELKSMIDELNT